MTEERRPWYLRTLSRMDARARELCPSDTLCELGNRIISADLSGLERDAIDVELERMLKENGDQYDQAGASFLKHFQQRVKRLPWYMILLGQMAEYAQASGFLRNLQEAGEDLRLSCMDAAEREAIVAELTRMLHKEQHTYRPASAHYLSSLRVSIRASA